MLVPIICMTVASTGMLQDANPADLPPRDAAIAVARWLDSVQVETEHGIAWPVAPADSPDVAHNLYAGTPGVILFFIELHKATGDEQYLDRAKEGGDDLLAALPETREKLQVGLYTGIAGQGFVLNELFEATKDDNYLAGANRCVDLLVAHALDEEREDQPWNGVTDIIGGAAGAGCFLLYAHREMGRDDALAAAMQAGDWLISKARPVDLPNNQRGLEWAMSDDFPRMMPNFSHGTAGVAYFLAVLHGQLRYDRSYNGRFAEAAREGAKALVYLSGFDSDKGQPMRIYHHRPGGEDLFYLGWCHGPTGTARLFLEIGQIFPHENHGVPLSPLVFGLIESGIPEQDTPGFWNNVGQCCGSAGVASFSLSLHGSFGQQEALDFAKTMHRDLMQRATVGGTEDAPTLSWLHAEHRVRPEFLQAQTGYMQGAAGIGLWLLQLDAHTSGREWTLQFPDSPWSKP